MKNYAGYGHLTIGGKKRPLYFGVVQAKIYCQLHRLEFHEYDEKLLHEAGGRVNPFFWNEMLYAALVAGCKYEKTETDFTTEDVAFWMPEMAAEDWQLFFQLLKDSNGPNPKAPAAEPSTGN